MPIKTPRVLVELNGADPVMTYSITDVRVDVLDYDEIDQMTVEELVAIHDTYEEVAPRTARSIRDHLRGRGVIMPAEYNTDFDKE